MVPARSESKGRLSSSERISERGVGQAVGETCTSAFDGLADLGLMTMSSNEKFEFIGIQRSPAAWKASPRSITDEELSSSTGTKLVLDEALTVSSVSLAET